MDEDVKNKILLATYELLLQNDITKITTRKIAARAEVSLSLLHYYFKTKYDLFEYLYDFETPKYHNEWKSKNINMDNPEPVDLENYFIQIMETVYKLPTFAKSLIYLILKGYKLKNFANDVVNDINKIIAKLLPDLNSDQINRRMILFFSVTNSFRISNELVFNRDDVDINNQEDRVEYYRGFINDIFPELAGI